MNAEEVREFATRLMNQVWLPYDHRAVPKFYHEDVIGYHRDQTISIKDIINRLQWDVEEYAEAVYDIKDIIAEVDKFAIRFIYTAKIIPTGDPVRAEANYFYHLRDGKISEFWLLADVAVDYKQQPSHRQRSGSPPRQLEGSWHASLLPKRFLILFRQVPLREPNYVIEARP